MSDFLSAAVLSALGASNPLQTTLLGALLSAIRQKPDPVKPDAGSSPAPNLDEMLSLLDSRSNALRELAISRRIDAAEKVSIEEYYDARGGPAAAGKPSEQLCESPDADASSGQVVKRVYTFEGFRDNGLDELFSLLPALSPDLSDILSKLSPSTQEKPETRKSTRRPDAASAS